MRPSSSTEALNEDMPRGFETDDTLTLIQRVSEALPEPWHATYRLDQRYEIRGRLGSGGFGSVFRAFDHVTGQDVALKRLDQLDESRILSLRREIATLRMLQLPNVVRFLDEFTWEQSTVIVMEIIDGMPFPGCYSRCSWEDIRVPTLSLLETVGRLHDVGVVHRDIKPGNVLVTEDQRSVLVDFGISHVDDVVARFNRPKSASGTPAYMAPEQFFGSVGDIRSDLFAIGAMLFECFAGHVPHESGSRELLAQRRVNEPAASLSSLRPELPSEVLEAVQRMLAREPDRRPKSAGEVLAILNRRPYADRVEELVRATNVNRHEVMDWFVGPERLAARKSRAAEELLGRTGGSQAEVIREIRAWLRAGVARWQDSKLVIRDADLVRLESGLSLVPRSPTPSSGHAKEDKASLLLLVQVHHEGLSIEELREKTGWRLDRLDRVLASLLNDGFLSLSAAGRWCASPDSPSIPLAESSRPTIRRHPLDAILEELRTKPFDEALAVIETRYLRSDTPFARELIEAIGDALLTYCPPDDSASVEHVLELLISEEGLMSGHRVRRMLSRIDRIPHRTPRIDYLRTLLRAAERISTSDFQLVESQLRALGSDSEPEIERIRLYTIGFLRDSMGNSARASFIEELSSLSECRDPRREVLHFLRARHAYAESRFADSSREWDTLARLTQHPRRRLVALSNHMAVLLEQGDFRGAVEVVEELERDGKARISLSTRARMEWIRRSVSYRSGDSLRPDPELVSAVFKLGVEVSSFGLLQLESAIAWRCGDFDTIRELRSRFEDAGSKLDPIFRVMTDCFVFLEGNGSSVAAPIEFIESARRDSAPGLVAQILYLLALGGHPDAANFARDAVELINRLPTPDRSLRREIVSPIEIEELAVKLGVLDPMSELA